MMKRTLYIFLIFFRVTCSEKGNCTSKDRFGQITWFCCDNHELKNNDCVESKQKIDEPGACQRKSRPFSIQSSSEECSHGFESFDGSSCKQCGIGKYGRKCGDICSCFKNQICDNIKGCIQDSNALTTEAGTCIMNDETNELSFLLTTLSHTDSRDVNHRSINTTLETSSRIHIRTPTTKENVFLWLTTFTNSKHVDDSSIHSTTITSSMFRLGPSTTMRSAEKGILNREIVIYSLSASLLVIVILLCTACQHRYKVIYGNFKKYQNNNRRRRNIPENAFPEITFEEPEGIYEEIDESTMISNFEHFHGSNKSVTDRIKSNSLSDNNCYLTPYHAVDDDSTSNNSNENKSESSKSSDVNDQTANNHNVQWRRSSYLNPYQPIVHSAHIHEYLSIHYTDDICLSRSESLTRETDDVNSNIPMIQTMELQEFKSIRGSLSGSASSLPDTCTT